MLENTWLVGGNGHSRYMLTDIQNKVKYFSKYGLRAPAQRSNSYIIRKGDRIAQGVIAPVMRAVLEEADDLSETDRGDGGFGSTGVRG